MKRKFLLGILLAFISLILIGTEAIACGRSYSSPDVPPYHQCGYLILCKQKGGKIRGPSALQPGDTYGYRYHSPGSKQADQYDTPTFKCVGERALSMVSAYSLSSGITAEHTLQDAIWADMTCNEGQDIRGSLAGGTGYKLEQEGEEYVQFYNQKQARGGYNPIDTTVNQNVKTVVKQSSQKYIVGPFSIDYLYKQIRSVDGTIVNCGIIKAMSLIDQNNNVIDESNFEIVRTQNSSDIYKYPYSGEQFYIALDHNKYPNVRAIKIKVDFEYINTCAGTYHRFEGKGNIIGSRTESETVHNHCYHTVTHTHHHSDGTTSTSHSKVYESCEYCWNEAYIKTTYPAQLMMGVIPGNRATNGENCSAYREVKNCTLIMQNVDIPYDLTMNLGGYVFLDGATTGKAADVNGLMGDANDKMLSGIMVTLYEQNGQLAEVNKDLKNPSEDIRTNPTITNEAGYYEFGRIDPMKKYYVKFTYNGQIYTNTLYMGGQRYANNRAVVAAGFYNNQKFWQTTSKASETPDERTNLNNRFAEIGSYPQNYTSTNNIGYAQNGKNIVYQYEDLVDAYNTIEQYTRNYINTTKQWPDLKSVVYPGVAQQLSSDPQIKNKLQFIEDCMIDSYTGPNGKNNMDLYPVYDDFVIDNVPRTIARTLSDYNGTYPAIYPGQNYVNLGVKYRNTIDLALYKDVFKVRTVINDKTEVYYYDKRALLGDTFRFGLQFSDIDNVQQNTALQEEHLKNITNKSKPQYDQAVTRNTYTQYIRKEDINQSGSGATESAVYNLVEKDKLDIYATYKVAVKNQSPTVGLVTELVDYYDSNYTVFEAYLGDAKGNKIDTVGINTVSKYGQATAIAPAVGYSTVYLTLNDNTMTRLSDGETEYVYLTLRMKNPSKLLEDKGLLSGEIYKSYNFVEINGFKTYDDESGTTTPGYIDIDSTPGNFDQKTYREGTLLEDDTDLAPTIAYATYEERTMEGIVFEDRVTSVDYKNLDVVFTKKNRTADGKYSSGSDTPVKDVRVELVEIKNGKLEVRAYTYTDSNGYYKFDSYIPGQYIVRYIYGQEDGTALTTKNVNYTGSNEKSYNGQDFQATKAYNQGNGDKEYDDSNYGVRGKTLVNTFESTPYYWYSDTQNRSCASDVIARRTDVINYSKIIKNHIAEVLNSYKDSQVNRTLVNELEENTYMVAQTPEMTIETEYLKEKLEYDGTEQDDGNYIYKIQDVDFGLVERPRNKLTVQKIVSNLTLTASDGTVLASGDVDENGNVNIVEGNIKWLTKLKIENGLVSIETDQELLHGAKLVVDYKITVTNNSELDTYNNSQVTTRVMKMVDYVANNYTFDPALNPTWSLYAAKDVQLDNDYDTLIDAAAQSGGNSRKAIDLSIYQNIVISNEKNEFYKKDLLPGESVTSHIILEKNISTTEDDTDDFIYENDVEILQTTNPVGRTDHDDVPGDYDPTTRKSQQGDLIWDGGPTRPAETDTDVAERIVITPPTGGSNLSTILYIVSIIALSGIIVILIVLINKTKKDKK